MPIAITIAMLIVIGCYVLCNVAYFVVLGPDGMAKSTAVALVGFLFLFYKNKIKD